MKRVRPTYPIIFSLILFIFISKNISAQIDSLSENHKVYWFYVNVTEIVDTSGYVSLSMKRKRKKIQEGIIKEFDRSLWQHLSKGSVLAIGPFINYNDAISAYSLYGVNKDTMIRDSLLKSEQNVYWFFWRINKKRRKTFIPYIKERRPNAIASGSYKGFKIFLEEILLIRGITIGPFKSNEEAELAKRMYRLNENY